MIRTYTGTLPGVGELLVTAYDERTVEVAVREHEGQTWGVPHPLTAEPIHPSQAGAGA
jgi:hypothetical protein